MRVILFAPDAEATLVEELRSEGVGLEHRSLPVGHDRGEPNAALVSAFREAERALAGDPPEAVVVAGDGDEALATAITAVKLAIPTAWLGQAAGTGEATPLVGRVADVILDASADAAGIASQLREMTAPTITAP